MTMTNFQLQVRSLQDLAFVLDLPELHLVGGCVRDMVQGREAKDYDLCGPYLASEVKEKLDGANLSFFDKHLDYGVVSFFWRGMEYEYATWMKRVERASEFREMARKHGRTKANEMVKSVEVEFTTDIGLDAIRRDFTMNAMYWHIGKDQIVEPVPGSLEDGRNDVLRWVGSGMDRVAEDPSRILRSIRFGLRGYSFCEDLITREMVDKYAIFIPAEKIVQETEKVPPEYIPEFLGQLFNWRILSHHGIHQWPELVDCGSVPLWYNWLWLADAQLDPHRVLANLKLPGWMVKAYDLLKEYEQWASLLPRSYGEYREVNDKIRLGNLPITLSDIFIWHGEEPQLDPFHPCLVEEPEWDGKRIMKEFGLTGRAVGGKKRELLFKQMERYNP